MKLFIHNILKSLPLKIQANRIEKISMNYNREFLLRILQRIDYDRLKGAVKDVSIHLKIKRTIFNENNFSSCN